MLILHILACISIVSKLKKKLYFILIRQKFCMISFSPKAVTFYFGRHFLSNKARVDQELL